MQAYPCVYAYVCMHMCVCMCVYGHECMHPSVYHCAYVCVNACMCECVHAYLCGVNVYTHLCTCVHIHMHVCVNACIHMCTCVYPCVWSQLFCHVSLSSCYSFNDSFSFLLSPSCPVLSLSCSGHVWSHTALQCCAERGLPPAKGPRQL